MGQIFLGLTAAAPFLAFGVLLIWKKKAPRIAAISMFVAGCALVGTWFNGILANIAATIPPVFTIVAAIICGGAFVIDCWGKQNKAGTTTAIVGLVAPLLIVVAPLSLIGISPGDLIKEVSTITQDSGIVRAGTR